MGVLKSHRTYISGDGWGGENGNYGKKFSYRNTRMETSVVKDSVYFPYQNGDQSMIGKKNLFAKMNGWI